MIYFSDFATPRCLESLQVSLKITSPVSHFPFLSFLIAYLNIKRRQLNGFVRHLDPGFIEYIEYLFS